MNKETFVYCWTDHKNDMLYIGCHKGHLGDGYVCSSKIMLEEYEKRPEDFTRQIIAIGEDADMREFEAKLLRSANVAQNPDYYNQHNGDGKFTVSGRRHAEITKKKQSESRKKLIEEGKITPKSGEENPMFGTTLSLDRIEKLKIARARQGSIGKGVPKSKEHRAQISKTLTGRYQGEDSPNWGRKHPKEFGDNISKSKTTTLVTEEGRECVLCGKFKTWDKFYVKRNRRTGHTPRCKKCQDESYGSKAKKRTIGK